MTAAHRRIAAHALRDPDAPALVFNGVTWSFGDLWSRASGDARAIEAAGIGRGDRIGLAVPRSADLVSLVVGSLASGAAYVPLDPKLPAERLSYMTEDAGVSLVVLPTDDRPAWLPGAVASLSIDALRALDPSPSASLVPVGPDLTDLAYVIYTSGSTGRPKGARNTHANLAAILDAWSSVAHTTAGSTFLFHSTLSFDASLTEFLWPLSAGLRVVIVPDDSKAGFGASFGELIEAHRVTNLQCTPTRAVLLLSSNEDRRALRNLRQVLIGGEALPPALAHQLRAVGIGTITNIYGPTECSIWSFCHDVESTVGASVPIGRPLPGARAVVANEALQPVADGVEGELLIVGQFVGDGYHGRPELTDEKFRTLTIDGETVRAYRTGDRVVRRPDGIHDFLGRLDTQVKLRGQRIELGEIEAIMIEHPSVAQAVAAIVGHGLGDDRLVAYVITTPGVSFDEVGVRSLLASRVSAVMVPSVFVEVDAFPLTPSGKVDRRALPEPAPILVPAAEAVGGSALDRMINDFSTIFGRTVGPDDDFFALGGHSLLAVELLRRVSDRKGVSLPLAVMLDAPTPRLLVERATNPGGFSVTSSLVRYGASVAPTRLYLIHGAGGNVLGFRDLACSLRADVEVVGIQAAGVEPGQAPDRTMEAMVERYANAVRTDDPIGPYWLGGYSDGGLIALHLAQALRSTGGEIAGLVLLDSFVPEPMPPTLLGRLANVSRNARDRGGRSIVSWARGSWVAWKGRRGYEDANAAAAAALGYVGVDDVVNRAVSMMSDPGPIPAPALNFRSSEATPTFWFDYSLVETRPASSRRVWVPGGHSTVFTGANAPIVAEAIRDFVK